MIDSDTMGYPEQKSAGCHFGTLGRNFLRAKTKWPPDISRSNMFFSTNEARNKCNTSFSCDFDWAIHFWNFFEIRSSSRSKRQFQSQIRKKKLLTNKASNMCNTSFSLDFV